MMMIKYLLKSIVILNIQVHAILKAISIYGCETPFNNFVCSWVQPVDKYIDQLKKMGFNTLRFPVSYQYIMNNNWDAFDYGMYYANQYNMSVIIDMHRIWNDKQQYSPISDNLSIEQFTDAWITILQRYNGYKNLIGKNIYNEFQGGSDELPFLRFYTEYVMNKTEEAFPNRFNHYITGHSWSGNISGMSMEHLPYSDRIYYSVHKYHFSITQDATTSTYNYTQDWLNSFANVGLPKDKLIIGEFGWMESKPDEVQWAHQFIDFLKQEGIRNTCYWTLAHSHDTGNIYDDDCKLVKWDNYLLLSSLWSDRRNLRIHKI